MKVNGSHPHAQLDRISSTEVRDGGRGAKNVTTAVDAGGQRVQVSSVGRQLAAARGPETPDEARIDALRAALEAGELEIDPAKIAEAMLREER